MPENLPILLTIYSDYGITALRLALGLVLVAHGWPKISDVRGTATWLGPAGFRPAMVWAPIIAVIEFGGGLLLLAGVFARIVLFFVVLQFIVIIIWRLKNRDSFIGKLELDVVVLAAALALLTLGGGAWTIF